MVEPTCTGYGYTEHACKHCDYHYTSDIRQPLGHQGELQLVKEASCTEDGYTGDTVCNVCNEVIQTGKLIPATGHSFGEWAVTQEADCFHDGLQVRACTVCGQEETEPVVKNSERCPSKAFSDLDCSRWYHEGVDFALAKGFMNGMDTGIFSPDTNITRGQLVTVLYRLADEPQVQTNAPFTDVSEGSYYAKAVAWAYGSGIAEGVTKERFAPNASATREQMVVFFARFARLSGKTVEATGDLRNYTDAGSVSPYATEAMTWAVETGLHPGTGSYHLDALLHHAWLSSTTSFPTSYQEIRRGLLAPPISCRLLLINLPDHVQNGVVPVHHNPYNFVLVSQRFRNSHQTLGLLLQRLYAKHMQTGSLQFLSHIRAARVHRNALVCHQHIHRIARGHHSPHMVDYGGNSPPR